MVTIAERVAEVRERIAQAAHRVGRDPKAVALIAAKAPSVDAAAAALEAGVDGVGENRVADLVARVDALPHGRWHMIGRLQTNKVRLLPPGLTAIHSVDRLSLVARLGRHYHARKAPDLYVEVNVAGEASKGGVAPDDLPSLLAAMNRARLRVAGLMTLAPWNQTDARHAFKGLSALAAEHNLPRLSMGMSDDYEIAVEEGSTLVRVGRALFEGTS